MTPGKAELNDALDVFEKWLAEEANAAYLNVGTGFNAKTATLPETAELVGVAAGLATAAVLLRGRVNELAED